METRDKIKTFIPALLLAAVTIVLFCFQLSVTQQSTTVLPKAIAFRAAQGLNLNFDDMKLITEESVSAVSLSTAGISGEYSTTYEFVDVRITDNHYAQIVSLPLIRGAYFEATGTMLQNRFAVISDKLAVTFFHTDDAIGKELKINDNAYIVCGVYRSTQERVLDSLSSTGRDTVYLPYQSMQEHQKLPVHLLYVDSATQFTGSVLDNITANTSKPPRPDCSSNFGDTVELIAQMPRISLFLVGCFLIIAVAFVMVAALKRAYHFHKADDRRRTLISGGVGLGCLLLIFILFSVSVFPLYLPSSLLPRDNIFDLAHYSKLMMDAFHQKNSILLNDFHWNYSFWAFGLSGLLTLLTGLFLTVTALTTALKIRKLRRDA